MSSIFAVTLSVHVIAGLVGAIGIFAITMSLAGRKPSLPFLKITSATALFSFLASWFTGGYYYVLRYGSEVKPIIKAGDNPWAHALFMEAKEHVFLFLPVLAFLFFLLFFLMGEEVLANQKYKKVVLMLGILASLIALFITLAGVLISGSAQ